MTFLAGLGALLTLTTLVLLVWRRHAMAHPVAGWLFISSGLALLARSVTAWLSGGEHAPLVDALNNGILPLLFRGLLLGGVVSAVVESEIRRTIGRAVEPVERAREQRTVPDDDPGENID